MIARSLATLIWAFAMPMAAQAESPCQDSSTRSGRSAPSRGCDTARPGKIEPYDPDRLKAGSRPGFIDLGGGTEIRVGGRARMEYESRR